MFLIAVYCKNIFFPLISICIFIRKWCYHFICIFLLYYPDSDNTWLRILSDPLITQIIVQKTRIPKSQLIGFIWLLNGKQWLFMLIPFPLVKSVMFSTLLSPNEYIFPIRFFRIHIFQFALNSITHYYIAPYILYYITAVIGIMFALL